MKLLIFGATGGTGRQLVEQALEQGHTVTAFARNPAKLDIHHANLKVVQGNVTDFASVKQAVQGQDAVLSAIGASEKRTTLRTDGTRLIIRAIEQAGIRRFISLSTLGIGDSQDMLPLHYKYFLVPFLLRHAFADHEHQEDSIKQSHLDWTIVRPAALINETHTGVYQHGFGATDKRIKAKISRADVADFMLRQLTDNSYLHKTPSVSY